MELLLFLLLAIILGKKRNIGYWETREEPKTKPPTSREQTKGEKWSGKEVLCIKN